MISLVRSLTAFDIALRVSSICSIGCSCDPRTRVVLKLLLSDPNSRKFSNYREILCNLKLIMISWRPLQQGNFKFFLAIPQHDQIFKPIWFCNRKLWYTIKVILKSQLQHMRLWANLSNLMYPSLLSPFLTIRYVCSAVRWLTGWLVW